MTGVRGKSIIARRILLGPEENKGNSRRLCTRAYIYLTIHYNLRRSREKFVENIFPEAVQECLYLYTDSEILDWNYRFKIS